MGGAREVVMVLYLCIWELFSHRIWKTLSPFPDARHVRRWARMSAEDAPAACGSTRGEHPPCESVFAGGLTCHLDRFARASFQVRPRGPNFSPQSNETNPDAPPPYRRRSTKPESSTPRRSSCITCSARGRGTGHGWRRNERTRLLRRVTNPGENEGRPGKTKTAGRA